MIKAFEIRGLFYFCIHIKIKNMTWIIIIGIIIGLCILGHFINKKKEAQKEVENPPSPTLQYISSVIGNDLMLAPDKIKGIAEYGQKENDPMFDTEEKVKSELSDFINAWHISNGTYPDCPTNFIPQKGEVCIYTNECEAKERKMVTKRVNYAGPRLRAKVAKGLSYNFGSANISTQKIQQDISYGNGTLSLTNKRVIFQSTQKTITIPFKSILNIEPYSDAIVLYKNTGNPLLFFVNDSNRLYLYLNAIIKQP